MKNKKTDKYKNRQATMPEGQRTDGQTELQSKCQGLEVAVAELDDVIRKQSDSVSVHHCGAIPIEK